MAAATTTRSRARAPPRSRQALRFRSSSSRRSTSGRRPRHTIARTSARRPRATSSPSPRRAPHHREIQQFLDQFTAHLTAGDGEACAACFEYPALMVMSDLRKYGPSQSLEDEQVVADFFAQAPAMYHARGIEDTFANVEQVDWIADDLALVRAQFPYIDADGNDMGDGESSIYLLRRTGRDFAIAAAITLGVDSDRRPIRRARGVRRRRR